MSEFSSPYFNNIVKIGGEGKFYRGRRNEEGGTRIVLTADV